MPDDSYITELPSRDLEGRRPVLPSEFITPEPLTVANRRRADSPAPIGPSSVLARVEDVPGYELLEELGRGGMGVVYRARQVKANRLVALKMILSGTHASDEDLARFRTEAEAVAHVQHPNVVQVFEVGEHRGRPFFSLELCEAGGLDRKLNGTPIPPNEAAALVEKLARAIQSAHDKGVVHRDLKPANVLLTAAGVPKITDFGLAKRLDEQGLTLTGAIMGTPSYMAPEQAEGKKEVGPAADIYALGAILYDCLTGRPPFKSSSAFDTIAQVIKEEPIPISRLINGTPRDLETICSKCLEKAPASRYPSAGALADDLARFLRGEAIHARPVGTLERAAKWVRRNPAVAGLTATTALALLLGAGVALGLAVYALGQADLAETKAKDAEDSSIDARRETSRADAEAAKAIDEAGKERTAREKAQTNENLLKRSRHAMRLMLSLQAWERSDIVRARSLLAESEPEFRTTWEERFVHALCVRRDPLFSLTEGTCGPLAMSADGQWIASAGNDKLIRVWDARTGRAKFSMKGHAQRIFGLAISADGRRIVSGAGSVNRPGEVKLWDGETGKELFSFDGHADRVTSVAISADGRRFVSGSWDKTVRLWDAETGKPMAEREGNTFPVGHVAMSADGKRIVAAASNSGAMTIWDGDKAQAFATFDVRTPGISGMAMSADGKLLAGCVQNVVTVWDGETGQEKISFNGHVGPIHRVAMSADGQRIVSGGADGAVRVWDTKTGLELICFRGQPVELHVGGRRNFLKPDEVLGVAVSADGRHIVSGGQDAPMKVWDAKTGQEDLNLTGHTNAVYCVAFTPDSKRIVTGSFDNTIKIWDAETGCRLYLLEGHTGRIVGLAVSADGRRIVSASQDGKLKIWDAHTGKLEITLACHPGTPTCVAFSPDGKQIVSGGWETTVKIWDVLTGKVTHTFQNHANHVACVSWSPDGKRIASGGSDHTVLVWDPETRKVSFSLQGHAGAVNCVQWSPDGVSIASASADKTLRVWNAAAGKGKLVLSGHGDEVTGVAWSPDGKRLASVSYDRTVKVWDAETGQGKITLEGHTAQVWGVAWSPDGRRIVSGAWDKTAKVWSVGSRR